MDQKTQGAKITEGELEELIKDAVTPIDFEALIQAGVLEKRGSWYVICRWNELPSHAKSKIKTVRMNKNNETLVQFRPVSRRLEKLYRRTHA